MEYNGKGPKLSARFVDTGTVWQRAEQMKQICQEVILFCRSAAPCSIVQSTTKEFQNQVSPLMMHQAAQNTKIATPNHKVVCFCNSSLLLTSWILTWYWSCTCLVVGRWCCDSDYVYLQQWGSPRVFGRLAIVRALVISPTTQLWHLLKRGLHHPSCQLLSLFLHSEGTREASKHSSSVFSLSWSCHEQFPSKVRKSLSPKGFT